MKGCLVLVGLGYYACVIAGAYFFLGHGWLQPLLILYGVAFLLGMLSGLGWFFLLLVVIWSLVAPFFLLFPLFSWKGIIFGIVVGIIGDMIVGAMSAAMAEA